MLKNKRGHIQINSCRGRKIEAKN